MTLTLDVPPVMEQDTDELRAKRLRAAIALFDAQLITQGQAAQMAGLSRVAFFDELGKHGVTPLQYDWEEDIEQAMKFTVADEGQKV